MMRVPAHISVEEIRKPELDAYLVAENIGIVSIFCHTTQVVSSKVSPVLP